MGWYAPCIEHVAPRAASDRTTGRQLMMKRATIGRDEPNMGRLDQSIRLVGGALLVGLALILDSPWYWLGLYPLATALVTNCPLYRLFGVNSLRLGY
jgi:hypothetical protein